MVAEAAFVGGGGLFLLGVAGDQGGVDVQDQAGQFTASGLRGGYGVSSLVCLQPGDLAGPGPSCPQGVQSRGVDACQYPPGGRSGGDGAEHVALVAQHGQVGDRLAAVGEHHREVHRDAAGVVPGATRPQSAQSVGESAGQCGGVGQIRE
ncbi:hypothetical protein ADL00_16380 [Streptomyces sp. AS58]|nr:hypothetical protein ADL00_16380 [Streptomyces sp. AS58]